MASHVHGQSVDLGVGKDPVPAIASYSSYGKDNPKYSGLGAWISASGTAKNQAPRLYTDYSGNNQPHNTIQPVFGVYRYRRIS